jgi:cold shock CspA family protein
MKDRILESYFKDFITENDLSETEQSKAFEHFVNYCIISREHPENFNFESLSVGGTDDLGVDGIGILVNEHLVTSKKEIDFFKQNLRRLDVKFIFIQSKTSSKFGASEIGNFIFGVKRFFNKPAPDRVNKGIKELIALKEYIYDSSIDMDLPPVCAMFYVTTGKWKDDSHLIDRIQEGKKDLLKTDLFSEISFYPIDVDGIKGIYKQLKLKITKEINFERHTILPPSNGIREAYIGIIPCKEYLKLVTGEDESLLRKLFYDNVRDFQGNNPVNTEINETLNNPQMNDKFALFNNGITVVARSINKVGTSFRINHYQIVNGCQTSHILYRNRMNISPDSMIPIKLIVTEDTEITNLIIKATNRQSEVKLEAFESLLPFQKKLEEFYMACSKECDTPIYYERRSRQYDHLPINKNQIVSLSTQIICFVAMFLNEPQSTHRYYGELLDAYRGKIFLDNHSPYPYFLSGFALFTLDKLFKMKLINVSYKKFKYHILMLFRVLFESQKLPYLNSNVIDDYCSKLHNILMDEKTAIDTFKKCIEILENTIKKSGSENRESVRLKAFTTELLNTSNEKCNCEIDRSSAEVEREQGVVKWFSDLRGYGFIKGDSGKDIFVHYKNINGPGYRTLKENERVEFTVIYSEKGYSAQDVFSIK